MKVKDLEFSAYLKRCRETSGMTQEELVWALYNYDKDTFENLDTVTLSRWERDSTKPNRVKQLGIIQFFQLQSAEALPCWDHYTVGEVEELICTFGIKNVLGKHKKLILNFPSEMMQVDEMKVYPIRDIENVHALFDLNMDLHKATNAPYTQISLKQFETWAKHPSNLFLACEYKEIFVGLFFSLKVKENVFDKLMNFELKKGELKDDDFAVGSEKGCDLLLSFYALNDEVATLLFVRHYAYLIANQRTITQIGVLTALDEVKKTVSNMNLKVYKSRKLRKESSVSSYRQSLRNVLATDYVVKMIFSD